LTEAEWIASEDPKPMLSSLRGALSRRKLRLFACACCRRVWHLLADERSRSAVELAERYADGQADDRHLVAAEAMARAVFLALPWEGNGRAGPAKLAASAVSGATIADPENSDSGTVFGMETEAGFAMNAVLPAWLAATDPAAERAAQAELLRDILGTPFRRVAADPAWLTPTVRALAEGIYEDRAFDQLPILADALEDAGCEEADLFTHCRSSGLHALGCWAVDLLLGKQ
jgi:hypothetical protein